MTRRFRGGPGGSLAAGAGSIGGAVQEISRARQAARSAAAARRETRRAFDAVEGLVRDVEDVNLVRGGRSPAGLLSQRLAAGEADAGPAPAAVRAARSTGALHAALMDWQEQLLCACAPHRTDYPDLAGEV